MADPISVEAGLRDLFANVRFALAPLEWPGIFNQLQSLEAALANDAQSVPSDMVLVPRVSTQDMNEAATEVWVDDGRGGRTALNWEEAAQVWSAMIAAAPDQPDTPEGER